MAEVNKSAAVPKDAPVETKSRLIRWVNKGGVFKTKFGKKVQRGEIFLARVEEIPESFRDVIKPVDKLEAEVQIVAPMEYSLKDKGNGKFDIVDVNGKTINDKPLPENEAKEVLARLS